jgi:DNA-binding CsgD family transcriptional regulator
MPRTRTPPNDALEVSTFEVAGERMAVIALPLSTLGGVPLTVAEHRVAVEILAGRSNAEIARTLGISLRTVASHVARLLKKLGVGSRAELAAKLPQLGPSPMKAPR